MRRRQKAAVGSVGVVLNEVGDVVLDSAATQVLSEDGRYELLERLRRSGPARLDSATDDLAALAAVGLVEGPDDTGRWTAVGRGLFLEVPTDPAGNAAGRKLVGIMLQDGMDQPREWAEEVMPRLAPEWFNAAGRLGVRVALSPQELVDIQAAFEEVLKPYVNRSDSGDPALSDVRIVGYFMPMAG